MLVKVCLDYEEFSDKEKVKRRANKISNRIGKQEVELELKKFVFIAGDKGRTYTPATFYGRRDIASFKEMQIFCLDFDEGNISYKDVIKRGEEFGLKAVFVYESLSSSESLMKFRVGFVHIVPIAHKDIALFILRILLRIFPECDTQCIEVSRMYFGGKNVLYYGVPS